VDEQAPTAPRPRGRLLRVARPFGLPGCGGPPPARRHNGGHGRTRSVVEIGDRGPGDLLESPGRELDQTPDAASALPKMAGARLVARSARYKARKWMAHRARTPRYRTSSTVCDALASGNLMTDPAGSAGGASTKTPTMTKTATRRMPPAISARPPQAQDTFLLLHLLYIVYLPFLHDPCLSWTIAFIHSSNTFPPSSLPLVR
jgi:hypothetical protein